MCGLGKVSEAKMKNRYAPHKRKFAHHMARVHTCDDREHPTSACLAQHWQINSPESKNLIQTKINNYQIRGMLRMLLIRPIHLRHFGWSTISDKAVNSLGSS